MLVVYIEGTIKCVTEDSKHKVAILRTLMVNRNLSVETFMTWWKWTQFCIQKTNQGISRIMSTCPNVGLTATNFAVWNWLDPTNIPAVPSPMTLFVSWWALEDGTNTLSQNLRNRLPTNHMTLPGRANTWTTPWSKPQISISITFASKFNLY